MFTNSFFGGSALPAPLSQEEEKKYLSMLPDSNAKNILVEKNLRLVVCIAKRFYNTGIPMEDLISVGTIGLIKGINTFHSDKKTKLVTYVSRCIENEMLMLIRYSKKHSMVHSLEESVCKDSEGNELTIADFTPDLSTSKFTSTIEDINLLSSLITIALNELSFKDCFIFFYMLAEKTQKECAFELGVKQSCISRRIKKIFSKMKHFLQFRKKTVTKDFAFYILNEDFCYIGFKQFTNEMFATFLLEKGTLFPFLSDFKLESKDNYTWIKMPLYKDGFWAIAELLKFVKG